MTIADVKVGDWLHDQDGDVSVVLSVSEDDTHVLVIGRLRDIIPSNEIFSWTYTERSSLFSLAGRGVTKLSAEELMKRVRKSNGASEDESL